MVVAGGKGWSRGDRTKGGAHELGYGGGGGGGGGHQHDGGHHLVVVGRQQGHLTSMNDR